MWLKETAYHINRGINSVSGVMHSVGVGMLALMMFLTFADVALRYFFKRPIAGTYENTAFMLAIIVGLSIAYTATVKGHISIDLVVSRLPTRTQAIIDSITSLISLGLFSLITWQYVLQTITIFGSKWLTMILYIPYYPFYGVVTLGIAMLTLVLLAQCVENISQAVSK